MGDFKKKGARQGGTAAQRKRTFGAIDQNARISGKWPTCAKIKEKDYV